MMNNFNPNSGNNGNNNNGINNNGINNNNDDDPDIIDINDFMANVNFVTNLKNSIQNGTGNFGVINAGVPVPNNNNSNNNGNGNGNGIGIGNNNPNNNSNNTNGNNSNIGGNNNNIGLAIGGNNNMNSSNSQSEDISDMLINYNETYKSEDPILFRDDVIKQILSCLIGVTKPNALIIGSAGTGKTKIVEDIGRRLANNDTSIPDQLKGYTLWEIPLNNLSAGASYVGDVEKRVKALVDFISDKNNKVILFIDEIHMLMSGDKQTSGKISQALKPVLARGNVKVIGSTTTQEATSLMSDPAFQRRFTKLVVDELTIEQTKEIVKNMIPKFQNHYNKKLIIDDAMIDDVINISENYKTVKLHRPDNVITLMDRSLADEYMNIQINEHMANKTGDKVLAATIKASLPRKISHNQIKKALMKLMTGNEKRLSIDDTVLRDELSSIKGQDDAVDYLIDKLKRYNLDIYPKEKPLTFLLTGNSGVGKTEVAKVIASYLTNAKPIILNMTEFDNEMAITRIMGASAGYVGSDSNNELPFDILETNPYQVIILDEFEKADRGVQRLFMQIFDEGIMTTSKGQVIDFSKSIIFATTNAGCTTKSNPIGLTSDDYNNGPTVEDLSDFMDKELINRFTKIIPFHDISKDTFKDILRNQYASNVKRIKDSHRTYAYLDDELPDTIADDMVNKHYEPAFGARHVSQIVQEYIEDNIMSH